MHDLVTIKRLNDTAVDGLPVNQARAKRDGVARRLTRNEREGWVPYPHPLKPNGAFDERLGTIVALVGSTEYEYKIEPAVYVRRVQD